VKLADGFLDNVTKDFLLNLV